MSIRLSEKHGVNPSINVCFLCGQDKNEIVLPGRLPCDAEAPNRAVWDKTPCNACQGLMQKGIMLISVRDGESGENPYRTGNMVVMSENWVRRVISPPMNATLLETRVAFVPDETWKLLGLPWKESEETSVEIK